jgi:hypothetical protein
MWVRFVSCDVECPELHKEQVDGKRRIPWVIVFWLACCSADSHQRALAGENIRI